MHRNVCWIGLVFYALASGVGGCSGPTHVDVTGRVTYNGSPLDKPGGTIVFVGAEGTQTVASIGPNGAYRAINVPTGPNKVAEYYPNPQARTGKLDLVRPQNGERPQPVAAASPYLTPNIYASVDASDLSIQVEKGAVFDADLTGPKFP
jgi:hypothetical protein